MAGSGKALESTKITCFWYMLQSIVRRFAIYM